MPDAHATMLAADLCFALFRFFDLFPCHSGLEPDLQLLKAVLERKGVCMQACTAAIRASLQAL